MLFRSRVYNQLSEKPGTREIFVGDVALLVISGCSAVKRSHFLQQRNLARRPKRKPLRPLQRLRLLVWQKKRHLDRVGPGVTSLPMQDCILANLRVKAGGTLQPRVSSSTWAGRDFEVDSEEEELD